MQQDLTSGAIGKTVARFSLPFFLAYFLQALYGLADLYFIGLFNGAAVISAVSIGSQVMHMVTVMTVGLALATTVLVGNAVGAKDKTFASKAVGNSITLFAVLTAFVMAAALLLRGPIVSAMKTPDPSVEQTLTYLTICFAGIPFIVAYNVIAAVFRGLGDSKTPMYFVAIACVLNIVLDYVFIGPMHLRAAGAALGTIIAQAVSVLCSLLAIRVRKIGIELHRGDLRPDKDMLVRLLKLGILVSLQEGFIQIAFLLITVIANSRGVSISAAVGIVEKIITFLFLVPSTMMSTTSAMVAQNMGAGLVRRSRLILFTCMGIAVGCGAVFTLFCNLFPESIVGFFTKDPAVIRFGAQYLRPYSSDCVLAAIHFCFSGYFTARGLSYIQLLHNTASIVTFRVPRSYLASKWWPATLFPMGCAAPLGSLLSDLICLIVFLVLQKKDREKERETAPVQTDSLNA